MPITRGTTPTARLTAKNVNLTGKQLQITFQTGAMRIIKETSGGDISVSYDPENAKSVVQVALTQQETLQLISGSGRCQIRWISELGQAGATKIAPFTVDPILKDGVLEWEAG